MTIVDSHCHLFDLKNYILPSDIYPIVVGYSHSSNKKAASFQGKYPTVLGIAPQTAIKEGLSSIDEWVDFIHSQKPNAIGEIGLDYKWAENQEAVEKQRVLFNRMLELSKSLHLPVVIHSRNNPRENDVEVPKNAIDEILDTLEKQKITKFLMHFYSGNELQAQRIVSLGGYVSILALRSKERKKVINIVPLERLLVESDCPYVGRNPEIVRDAVGYIAEVKSIKPEKVEVQTTKNAQEFFGFKIC
ncbi:TatD family hydrolase, partial [Candidatus Micrarchaeota archaeon]|nr:TatD family hydrolase [Candidatus Micrarchaeota archaeon]